MKTINIKQRFTFLLAVFFFFAFSTSLVFGQGNVRTEIDIPEIPGYVTLKCDFHMHTVFSDGLVWPTVRVGEAWKEGLNALAISDHIEYQPHRKDIPTDHNRSYEIALRHANSL